MNKYPTFGDRLVMVSTGSQKTKTSLTWNKESGSSIELLEPTLNKWLADSTDTSFLKYFISNDSAYL
jgi:hypothetical protein